MSSSTHSRLAPFLMIFIPFGLGHFISYLFRTINALIYSDLVDDLGLPAESLGLLTGVYFLAFAFAQIPLGVMLDRYGPRIIQTLLLLVAAIGSLIFAMSDTLWGLLIGRSLIGLGVSGCLMSAIKACTIWLPKERLAMSTAALLSIGGLGAIASTTPLHYLLHWISWREAFLLLSVITAIISAIIFFTIRGEYRPINATFSKMFSAVKTLYCSRSFWRVVLYSLLAHATYMALLALWMGPWLRDVAGLAQIDMAKALLIGAIAMVLGSLSFGWMTDRLQLYGIQPMMVCGSGIILFIAVQCLMLFNLPLSPWLITFLFSFFGTSSAMNYAIVARSVPEELSGRVTTSFNLLIFLFSFIIQWLFGAILGLWKADSGYPLIAYQWAIGIILLLQIPGIFIWLSFKPWQIEDNRK